MTLKKVSTIILTCLAIALVVTSTDYGLRGIYFSQYDTTLPTNSIIVDRSELNSIFLHNDGSAWSRHIDQDDWELMGHRERVIHANMSLDGTSILTVGEGGKVKSFAVHRSRFSEIAESFNKKWSNLTTAISNNFLLPLAILMKVEQSPFLGLFSIKSDFLGTSGRTFKDCSACPELVEIFPGSYIANDSEEPVGNTIFSELRIVTVKKTLAVARFRLSRKAWNTANSDSKWESATGRTPTLYPTDESSPINLTFRDTRAYIDWLINTSGYKYRLLNKAEWTYIASGGRTQITEETDDLINTSRRIEEKPKGLDTTSPHPWTVHTINDGEFEWTRECGSSDEELSIRISGVDCEEKSLIGLYWSRNSRQADLQGVGLTDAYLRVARDLNVTIR